MLLPAIFSSPSAMLGISPHCQGRFHSSRSHAAPYYRQDDHPRIPTYIFHLQRRSLGCRSHHPEQRQCPRPYTKKASHFRPYRAEQPHGDCSHDILPSGGTVPGAHLMPPTVGPGQLLFPKSPLPLPCPDVTFTGVSFSIYPIWGNRSPGMFLLKSEMNESMVTEYHTKSLATAWQLHSKRRVSAPCNCN